MGAVWFMIGVLTTLVAELVACIIYAFVDTRKGGKK